MPLAASTGTVRRASRRCHYHGARCGTHCIWLLRSGIWLMALSTASCEPLPRPRPRRSRGRPREQRPQSIVRQRTRSFKTLRELESQPATATAYRWPWARTLATSSTPPGIANQPPARRSARDVQLVVLVTQPGPCKHWVIVQGTSQQQQHGRRARLDGWPAHVSLRSSAGGAIVCGATRGDEINPRARPPCVRLIKLWSRCSGLLACSPDLLILSYTFNHRLPLHVVLSFVLRGRLAGQDRCFNSPAARSHPAALLCSALSPPPIGQSEENLDGGSARPTTHPPHVRSPSARYGCLAATMRPSFVSSSLLLVCLTL